jgi:hypothetical protein
MNTRNERKRAAKARKLELLAAQKQAFAIEAEKRAVKAARNEALIAVNQWQRPGTRCVCYPGLVW